MPYQTQTNLNYNENTDSASLTLIFEDHFDQSILDREKWLPYYLPHWAMPGATEPCYRITDSYLRLMIDEDQGPWCPEHDGQVKVSNLQTGHFAGPVGSSIGQHKDRNGLIVRSDYPEQKLFLPQHCRLEMRARAVLNSWNLAALWLIGFADRPEQSGEITVFEAFGYNVGERSARIGRGIKPITDPNLEYEFDDHELAIQIGDWNIYRMDWKSSGIEFYVNEQMVSRTFQSPSYPMQLMLNFYDLPEDSPRGSRKEAYFDIDYIKAWEWVA